MWQIPLAIRRTNTSSARGPSICRRSIFSGRPGCRNTAARIGTRDWLGRFIHPLKCPRQVRFASLDIYYGGEEGFNGTGGRQNFIGSRYWALGRAVDLNPVTQREKENLTHLSRPEPAEPALLGNNEYPANASRFWFHVLMQLEEIRLSHFQCFKELKIQCSKVTLLPGANSSGKSSSLHGLLGAIQTNDFPVVS